MKRKPRAVLLAPRHTGETVMINPDVRGVFLPLLRDEPLWIIVVENRGTKRAPEWFALCQSSRTDKETGALAERWIDCACLAPYVVQS